MTTAVVWYQSGLAARLRESLGRLSLYDALLLVALATGWLLPNHYPPWSTFHNDAWTAAALLLVAARVVATVQAPIAVSGSAAAVLALSGLPWLQHAFGLIHLRSDALVCSLYIAAFGCAYLLGSHWQTHRQGAPLGFVLLASMLASFISVGLALYQWLGLAVMLELQQFWIVAFMGGGRPYANLAQPNQLASLLLWGVLGVAWLWQSRRIGRLGAIAGVAYLLVGLALTESRTAFLSFTVTVLVLSFWQPVDTRPGTRRGIQLLYAWYLVCVFSLERVGRLLDVHAPLSVFDRSLGENVRQSMWRMALDAASREPWFGYGWNDAKDGLLRVFPDHPALFQMYVKDSHNLFFDLLLWVGWPLTLAFTAAAIWWLWTVVRRTSTFMGVLGVVALMVMLVHAMLEYPLHYGYFLWPFGLICGALGGQLWQARWRTVPRRAAAAMLALLAIVHATVVHDYLNIEAAWVELRMQVQRIGSGHDETPPQTYLLTDWTRYVQMIRAEPRAGMSESELADWEALMKYYYAPFAIRRVIAANVMNGRIDRASYWADRSCALLYEASCRALKNEWIEPFRRAGK